MITFSRRFKKRKNKKFFFLVLLVVLAGVLLVFLITLNLKIIQERAKLQRELTNLQRELQKSQAGREELITKMSKAQSGDYLEKIARQDLNLQKEGEKVVAFVIEEREAEQEKEEEEKSFWQKILDWLLKILDWFLEKLKIR